MSATTVKISRAPSLWVRFLFRLDGLQFTRPKPRSWIECGILLVLVAEVTYLASSKGYESATRLTWHTTQSVSSSDITRFLASMVALHPSSKERSLRLTLPGERKATLTCVARSAEDAEAFCNSVASDAVRHNSTLQVAASPTNATRLRCSLLAALWAGMTAAMLWGFVRVLRSSGYASTSMRGVYDSAGAWSRRSVTQQAPVARVTSAPPPPLPRVGHLRIKPATSSSTPTIDLPVIRPAAGAATEVIAAREKPHTAKVIIDPVAYEQTITAEIAPLEVQKLLSHELTTKIIYRVGTLGWVGDREVLGSETLTQLRTLSESLASASSEDSCKVVRLASDQNSRYAKSQVAAQLAWLLAENKDLRVLLMEADVDAPVLHTLLRLTVPRGSGFSEQLERFKREQHADSVTIMRINNNLHALLESRWGSPAELDSPMFTRVLAHQKREQDVIVIDGPVVDTWADAGMLKDVGDVVFVIANGTDETEAKRVATTHFAQERLLKIMYTGGSQER